MTVAIGQRGNLSLAAQPTERCAPELLIYLTQGNANMRSQAVLFLIVTLLANGIASFPVNGQSRDQGLPPEVVRAIAKEAYVYGFPMVDNLRIQYSYFVDRQSAEFKAAYNQISSTPRVYTPDDKAIQTPNSDTPYSSVGLDLRTEPIVISIPKIEPTRYWSLQLIDLYTHNFDYLGSRTTGNNGGNYMIAGPNWTGEPPRGIAKVIRCETQIAMGLFRTQLFNAGDLENVKRIQAGYVVQPLSTFLGQPALKSAATIQFPKPLTPAEQKTSLGFFNRLNFGLQFCSVHPSEAALRARFAKIGVEPGQTIDFAKLSPEIRKAYNDGVKDAWDAFAGIKQQIDKGDITSGDVFGTRDYLKNNYLYRMTGAVLGIYGNTKAEAMYPVYFVDANGDKLNGANRYELRFPPGQLPPVEAFWSLTMYDQPASLLVSNPINRYLLNSTMIEQFHYDADGGLTLFLQHEPPTKEFEANWLPAPKGDFCAYLRLYRPKVAALDGTWKAPKLKRVTAEPVTPETYIRAETDRQFSEIVQMAGGVNRFFHFRKPTPLDKQNIVRMNRDTLYSMAVVDTSQGATITIPELPKERYASVFLVDNDHYCPFVIYESGKHELPRDTRYLGVGVRIKVFNPKDEEEIVLVNKLQDQFVIEAGSADLPPPLRWDVASLKALTEQYEKEGTAYASYKGMMGPRGKVDEQTRHIAAAAAWGLFPEWDATYLNYSGSHDIQLGYKATYPVPENQAFWSITIYGKDGFIKSENCILNSSNVKLNPDGTFTAYFGSKELCGDVPNRLDVTEGWNFLMRIYRPGTSVLDGAYKLPEPVLVK